MKLLIYRIGSIFECRVKLLKRIQISLQNEEFLRECRQQQRLFMNISCKPISFYVGETKRNVNV